MFSILPCSDPARVGEYPEGTTLLIYKDNGTERGHVAYYQNKSAIEIISMEVGEDISPDLPLSEAAFLHGDALVRSVGSIALGKGLLTLCTKLYDLSPLLDKLGFFRNGDYYILYLNKLFAKGCSGCSGCSGCN